MSLTSYRAAPPRDGGMFQLCLGWFELVWLVRKIWRRPTFPHLKVQYHRRWGVSRPSSGWDRVDHSPPWPPDRPSQPFGVRDDVLGLVRLVVLRERERECCVLVVCHAALPVQVRAMPLHVDDCCACVWLLLPVLS